MILGNFSLFIYKTDNKDALVKNTYKHNKKNKFCNNYSLKLLLIVVIYNDKYI